MIGGTRILSAVEQGDPMVAEQVRPTREPPTGSFAPGRTTRFRSFWPSFGDRLP